LFIPITTNSQPKTINKFFPWPVRLGVRTPGFHPGNTGSNPVRAAKLIGLKTFCLQAFLFFRAPNFSLSPIQEKRHGTYPNCQRLCSCKEGEEH
jgi:hypothetical protein